ncbi:hypothetical protein [Pseudorhodoplanes sp.]|uniref:hypothetical protein n=1 Tax=Pseudorhodoplanes sp. TaxID=1934341 RepID=UPI002B851FF8|nr:hypothetical protein [Pseudorhodoplanes sp.]HWV44079.1 hypothetical protein [Pseudorhodoplanes sp.]
MIYMNSKTLMEKFKSNTHRPGVVVTDKLPDGEFRASELPREILEELLDNFASMGAGAIVQSHHGYSIEMENGIRLSGKTLSDVAAEVRAYDELCEFRENIRFVRVPRA